MVLPWSWSVDCGKLAQIFVVRAGAPQRGKVGDTVAAVNLHGVHVAQPGEGAVGDAVAEPELALSRFKITFSLLKTNVAQGRTAPNHQTAQRVDGRFHRLAGEGEDCRKPVTSPPIGTAGAFDNHGEDVRGQIHEAHRSFVFSGVAVGRALTRVVVGWFKLGGWVLVLRAPS